MKAFRTVMALALSATLATPAGAGDLAEAAAKAAETQTPQLTPTTRSSKRALMWTGAALFAGGMATALFGFIRVDNGEFSQFGEASSRNKPLGAAGIAAAFSGGTLMFMASHRGSRVPSVSIGAANITVSKNVSW
jgi:hypothetical protein